MCRQGCRNVRSAPEFRQFSAFPIRLGPMGLWLIGLHCLVVNFGCTSSGAARRPFTAHLSRTANSPSQERQTGSSTDRVSEIANKNLPKNDRSDLQLVGGQEQPADSTIPVENATNGPNTIESDGTEVDLPPSGLSLANLQILAVQNNPTLSQAQAAITAEQGIYRQAGLYPNPQIGYLNSTASNLSVKQSNGVFFSQEFVTAHKLQLAQQSASVEIRRYQWDLESQRLRILNDLKIRYYEVLGAQQAMEFTEEMVKIAEKGLAIARRNFEELKHGTKSDVLNAEVHVESVSLSRDDARHRYHAAWAQLATIAGVSPINPVPLLGDLTEEVPKLDLDACQQMLMANSPQIRSTECDLGHAWATYREQCAAAKPNITVQNVTDYDRATQATTFSTLIAMPLPINNRNQGNIDKSSADIVAAQAEIARVQLVLRDQLADSFRRYQTSARQVERLRDVILPNVKKNLEVTEQVFIAQEIPFTTVLFAQQSYFQNQMQYVEALTELHKVVTEIQGYQLTGGLNPAAIGGAIQNQPGGGNQRQRALLMEGQNQTSKQLLPAAQIGSQ